MESEYSLLEKAERLLNVDFVESRAISEVNCGELARQLGISERTLRRHFASYKCQSLGQFIKMKKMLLAIRILIENPRLKAYQVAGKAGFECYRYFAYCFCDHFGMYPSEFRLWMQRNSR